MGRMIIKHAQHVKPSLQGPVKGVQIIDNVQLETPLQMGDIEIEKILNTIEKDIKNESKELSINIKEDKTNNNVMMTTAEKVELAQAVLSTPSIKKIKKDKGLIERAEKNKTILTEDNKELLHD